MRVAFLGDIALTGRYSLRRLKEPAAYFGDVRDVLSACDVVVGNLETPFVTETMRPVGEKSVHLGADPEDVAVLAALGLDAVNLANNHMWDYGRRGLRFTESILRDAGIESFGVDGRPWRVALDGESLCFEGFCSYTTNPQGLARYGEEGLNEYSVPAVREFLSVCRARRETPVVNVHTGVEHVHLPRREDVIAARQFARSADLVYVGHHPHVLQGVETHLGSLLAYSLGNFCFDDVWSADGRRLIVRQDGANRSGIVLIITVAGGRVVEHRVVPIFMGEDRAQVEVEEVRRTVVAWSELLNLPLDEYEGEFKRMAKHAARRWGGHRDWRWYAARIRLRSVRLLWRMILNRWEQHRTVTRHLGGKTADWHQAQYPGGVE